MNAIGAGVWGRLVSWLDHERPDDGYARLRRTPIAIDDTPRLAAFLDRGRLSADKAEQAFGRVAHRIRASRLMFVPALYGGIALRASRLRLVEYLTHQVRALRNEGFEADVAAIDTAATVDANARHIAKILAEQHRPTWVVTHSKGGLDFLHALVTNPEISRFVDGWIAFQAPFMGSPVADVVSGSRKARRIGVAALRLIGGDLAAIADLRTDRRASYMSEHAGAVARLVEEVPVTCVATTAGRGSLVSSWLPEWPTMRWMEGLGLGNDGLVPVNSAILPGSRHVLLDRLAHGEVAARHFLSGGRFDHVDLLKTLIFLTVASARGPLHGVAA